MIGPRRGPVAPAVARELAGLWLEWVSVPARLRPASPGLRARLRDLSDRGRGADAVALRTRPVPRAYRTFFRQIGLDPDVDRIPAERAAVARMMQGGLHCRDQIADACLLAVIETSVGVWALDGAALHPDGPGIGLSGPARGDEVPAGSLIVADPGAVHALLFADPRPGSAPGPQTTSVTLFAVGVPGVPEIHVHEALWMAADPLEPG